MFGLYRWHSTVRYDMKCVEFISFVVGVVLQTEEVSHELDWSRGDRERLDSFIMGRCVRRSVLEEALGWIPDPVAAALSKMDAASTKPGKDGVAPAADGEGGGSPGGAAVEAEVEEKRQDNGGGGSGERWVTGEKALPARGIRMSLFLVFPHHQCCVL